MSEDFEATQKAIKDAVSLAMSGSPWCEPDGCPTSICNGPHRVVKTTLGEELLREDQQPIGTPL